MRWRLAIIAGAIVALCIQPAAQAATEDAASKGLFVSPLRQYISLDAGGSHDGSLTVANNTPNPINVTLSVEQFSVANFTYDFTFLPAKEEWVKVGVTTIQLQPGKNSQVPFTIAPPPGSKPGGHYFSIVASTSFDGVSNVRIAALLYVTIKGQISAATQIVKDDLPFLAIGNPIPYQLQIKGTGNSHAFVFMAGQLHGFTAKDPTQEAAHIILPDTTRVLSGTIQAPLLPGVYKATFGYASDSGETKEKTRYIVYLPLWSVAIPAGLLLLWAAWRARRRNL
ncbi:MAG TPA: hypothetical protein VFO38_04795 [Candidatus Saccharimonadales bacterium]|nr:hypothetical protein [Candidatus Saccharimonadales bacterium]